MRSERGRTPPSCVGDAGGASDLSSAAGVSGACAGRRRRRGDDGALACRLGSPRRRDRRRRRRRPASVRGPRAADCMRMPPRRRWPPCRQPRWRCARGRPPRAVARRCRPPRAARRAEGCRSPDDGGAVVGGREIPEGGGASTGPCATPSAAFRRGAGCRLRDDVADGLGDGGEVGEHTGRPFLRRASSVLLPSPSKRTGGATAEARATDAREPEREASTRGPAALSCAEALRDVSTDTRRWTTACEALESMLCPPPPEATPSATCRPATPDREGRRPREIASRRDLNRGDRRVARWPCIAPAQWFSCESRASASTAAAACCLVACPPSASSRTAAAARPPWRWRPGCRRPREVPQRARAVLVRRRRSAAVISRTSAATPPSVAMRALTSCWASGVARSPRPPFGLGRAAGREHRHEGAMAPACDHLRRRDLVARRACIERRRAGRAAPSADPSSIGVGEREPIEERRWRPGRP